MLTRRSAIACLAAGVRALSGCTKVRFLWQLDSEADDPLFRFVANGKVGYMDAAGRTVIPARLQAQGMGGRFHDGRALIEGPGGPRFIDRTGEVVFHPNPWPVSDFSEGLALAAKKTDDRAGWGYLDVSGKWAIPPRFHSAGRFTDGLARVGLFGETGSTGYIDRRGNFVIGPELTYGGEFREGICAAIFNGGCVPASGGSCGPPVFRPAKRASIASCRYALIDRSGKAVSPLRVDYAAEFSEGLAAVLSGDRYGYADRSGRVVIPFRFGWAGPFSEGLAEAKLDDRVGFINSAGTFAIPPRFDSVERFAHGRAPVGEFDAHRQLRYRYIDASGDPAFPGEFEFAGAFTHGLAPVKLLGEKKRPFAWIDTSGRIVLRWEESW